MEPVLLPHSVGYTEPGYSQYGRLLHKSIETGRLDSLGGEGDIIFEDYCEY